MEVSVFLRKSNTIKLQLNPFHFRTFFYRYSWVAGNIGRFNSMVKFLSPLESKTPIVFGPPHVSKIYYRDFSKKTCSFCSFQFYSVRLFMTVEEAVVSDHCSISRRYFK